MSLDLDKFVEINQLYRFYYPLLTEKQQNIIAYYYHDNYSISEIAELENVSRNAVHDQLKRTVSKLYNFENRLGLLRKFKARQDIIQKLKERCTEAENRLLLEALEKVE